MLFFISIYDAWGIRKSCSMHYYLKWTMKVVSNRALLGGNELRSPWCTCLTLAWTIDLHLNVTSWMTLKYYGVKFLGGDFFEILKVQLSDLTSGRKASSNTKLFWNVSSWLMLLNIIHIALLLLNGSTCRN